MAIILEAVPSILSDPISRFDWFVLASLRLLQQKCVWLGVVGLGVLLAAPSSNAQQGEGNVILEPSEQVFCVMAALNAGGYDAGLGLPTGDNTREEARNYLNQVNAPVAKELERFYKGHRVEGDPGADLGQYVSLALLLGPPPDFKFVVPADGPSPGRQRSFRSGSALKDLLPTSKTS